MGHLAGHVHLNRDAQLQPLGRRAQRPQALKLLLAALLGDLAGGAVGPLVVRLVQPLAELLDQVVTIVAVGSRIRSSGKQVNRSE